LEVIYLDNSIAQLKKQAYSCV